MRRVVWLALLVIALGACAATPRSGAPGSSADVASGSARDRARIHTELGVTYYEAGKLAVALEELNEAISADRAYAPAWNARALVYMDLREDANAEADFKQALHVDPSNSQAKNNYGLFLCQRGRGQEGIRYFLDAVKNPLYATPDVAYKNAGLCARGMRDLPSAEEYFSRALQLNGRQPQALYSMADMRFARGDAQSAKGFMDRYMGAVSAPGPEALWLAARIERQMGDGNALAAYAAQLRRNFPGSPETRALEEGRF
ncbi:MAG: type IV pilus biogenesis/stability protein PilW [Burkholderiales bacterium]|nr:type IV pilus biogenesis/stability protein PilW [Burkholderiales bacterium]